MASAAQIPPLPWKLPYATSVALKKERKKEKQCKCAVISLVLFTLSSLFCSAFQAAYPCRLSCPSSLVSRFPTGFGQWEALVLD